MSLRAFSVLETEENTGVIIFAKTHTAARRRGARLLADGEISYIACRRTPWADAFHETGKVPAATAVARGWWFECAGCGRRLDDNFFCDAPNRRYSQVVGFVDGLVYCTQRCKSREEAHKRTSAKAQDRMIGQLSALVRRRFPDAGLIEPGYAYASESAGRYRVVDDAAVKFSFPGMVHGPASLSMRRPSYKFIGPLIPAFNCCNGDVDAFTAYAKRTQTSRSAH